MGTPWDRASARYVEEWVPRFVPFHLDLVQELALLQGQRVLVVTSGPGSEVLGVARAVGERGKVRATDPNGAMIAICAEQIEKAGFTNVTCERAEASDVGEGDWNAVVCAFGLWQFEGERTPLIHTWAKALAPRGKVAVLTWGPPDEGDPFELLARALEELEPTIQLRRHRIDADRDSVQRMFDEAGLSLVRHTILHHTLTFPSAEAFVSALVEGSSWKTVADELGAERFGKVTALFYDRVGGITEPLTFEAAATLAIAALPGAAVDLAVRPSVVAPPLSNTTLPDDEKATPLPLDRVLGRRHEPWDDPPPSKAKKD